jgi:tetratricopeptide (TPR) repeat protein
MLLLKAVFVEPDFWESFRSAAAAVVNVLGSHTLTIVRAGAFIQQGFCSLEEYPNHFIQQRQRLLHFRPMQAKSVYGDVYATFEVSVKHLEDSARPSAKIALRIPLLLAFLHFDDVPMSVIVERAWENAKAIAAEGPETNSDDPRELTMWHVSRVFSLMQTSGDERKGSSTTSPERISLKKRRTDKTTFHNDDIDTILLNEARAYLASFSIVRVKNTSCTLTMHPLAHAWANDRLEASEREEARVAAGYILALSVWGWKYELVWLQLQPHLESYLHHWPPGSSLISFEVVPLLYALGRRLLPFWSLNEVERIFLLLVEHESVKINPNIDMDVSDVLATCYYQSGKISEAETLLQVKLHTYKSTFGPTHQGMLRLQQKLGEIYFRSEKSHEGVLMLETVVKIQQSTYEADTTGRLNAEQTLGVAYVQIGEFVKGIQLLERVVQIKKTTLQMEDPDRLDTIHSLAAAYLRIGQATKGIPILEEVVETQKLFLGEKSIAHLISQQALGRAYCATGETIKGIQLLETVVKIQESILQTDDRFRLSSLYDLGTAYLEIGQVEEAITLFEEVVSIRKVTLKPEHPNRLCSLHQLARAYLKIGRIEEAITLFEEVVKIRKVTQRPEDPYRLGSLHDLARAYLEIGRVEEAITLLEEVVHFDQMMLKPEDPVRQASEELLAKALRRRDRTSRTRLERD